MWGPHAVWDGRSAHQTTLPSTRRPGGRCLTWLPHISSVLCLVGALWCWIGCAQAPERTSWASPGASLLFEIAGPAVCIAAICAYRAAITTALNEEWLDAADSLMGIALSMQIALGYMFQLRAVRARIGEAGDDSGLVASVRLLGSGYNSLQALRGFQRDAGSEWHLTGCLMLVVSLSVSLWHSLLLRLQTHRPLPSQRPHTKSSPGAIAWWCSLCAILAGAALIFLLSRPTTKHWASHTEPHNDWGAQPAHQGVYELNHARFASSRIAPTKELDLTATQPGFSLSLESESGRGIYQLSVEKSLSRYLGCFVEPRLLNLRELPHEAGNLPSDSIAASGEICSRKCVDLGMRYYGLQRALGRVSCYCGNSFGRYERRPDWECELECPGDATAESVLDCVGWFKRSIYEASGGEKRYNVTQGYTPVLGRKVSSWSELSSLDLALGSLRRGQ